MSKKKFKWRLPPLPSGKFKSFAYRGWPEAFTNDENKRDVAYIKPLVAKGERPVSYSKDEDGRCKLQLVIKVASSSSADMETYGTFRWTTLKAEFASIQECKDALDGLYKANKHSLDNSNLWFGE